MSSNEKEKIIVNYEKVLLLHLLHVLLPNLSGKKHYMQCCKISVTGANPKRELTPMSVLVSTKLMSLVIL